MTRGSSLRPRVDEGFFAGRRPLTAGLVSSGRGTSEASLGSKARD